jgi:hypothetical protein
MQHGGDKLHEKLSVALNTCGAKWRLFALDTPHLRGHDLKELIKNDRIDSFDLKTFLYPDERPF